MDMQQQWRNALVAGTSAGTGRANPSIAYGRSR